ncbi:Com family DNA-binding transcriptional regulator [Acinetobacter sp. c3-l95]|uniref:Com family DNA-binding transcriptional regulator n=1 Tax=Acinetobacter sp. c3-l95 TaxID=3342804 RepID=UPI0035BB626F
MKFILCQNCSKKLLKIGHFDNLSIKCPRCKILNHLSVMNALPEAQEAQSNGVKHVSIKKDL